MEGSNESRQWSSFFIVVSRLLAVCSVYVFVCACLEVCMCVFGCMFYVIIICMLPSGE